MDLKQIEKHLRDLMVTNNINYMPTSRMVRESKIRGLESSIALLGGYPKVARLLNLSVYKPVQKWNEEKVKDQIVKVIEILGINRMPSRTEVKSVFKNDGLIVAIERSGGFYVWAAKLGLDIKMSETQKGRTYEELGISILNEKGYKTERTTVKCPYDILVNDNIRIDVKVCKRYFINGTYSYTAGINKSNPTCDIYLVFVLNLEDEIERTFIMPSNKIRVTSLNFGTTSKYDKYIDRWDFIDKYDKFYKLLEE